jgi:uncharacterized membrane protein
MNEESRLKYRVWFIVGYFAVVINFSYVLYFISSQILFFAKKRYQEAKRESYRSLTNFEKFGFFWTFTLIFFMICLILTLIANTILLLVYVPKTDEEEHPSAVKFALSALNLLSALILFFFSTLFITVFYLLSMK